MCNPGYYEVNDICESCPISTYKTTISNMKCTVCSENYTTDQTTSTQETDCGMLQTSHILIFYTFEYTLQYMYTFMIAYVSRIQNVFELIS